MEFIQFISQDVEHFLGFLAVLAIVFFGTFWLIIAIGMATAAARGYGNCDCEDEEVES
jgi:hypothetical protein